MSWFPVLLVTHIALAIALLLPSVVLPFMLRRDGGAPGPATRALMRMQGTGTLLIGAGLAVTGAAMLAMSTAWKSSLSSLATGAWPVMQSIGIESAHAA